MGWIPSIFGGQNSNDPLENLDPKLREFLQKESPVKYPVKESPTASTPKRDTINQSQPTDNQSPPDGSLYKDGRYAHLWKNYKPLAQIEDEGATDHDKLMNVLEGFKERKNAISKAAMENCAIQQEEWVNCMKNGSWKDQLQMCRHQVRRYERCYTMQARFLKALGYGSVLGRSPQVEDDIQMHADTLFQRMLKHEEAVEQAKKDGTPIPVFESGVPKTAAAAAVNPNDELQKKWKDKLEKLPEDEREAEEAALRADLQASSDVAERVKGIYQQKQDERDARQAAGQATFSDTISALLSGKGRS